MRQFFYASVLGAVLATGASVQFTTFGADPPPSESRPPLSHEGRAAKLKERDRLWQEAQRAAAVNKYDEAAVLGRKVVECEQVLLGAEDPKLIPTLEFVGRQLREAADWDAAASVQSDIVKRTVAAYGKDNYRAIAAEFALKDLALLRGLSPQERQALAVASIDQENAERLFSQNKFSDSEKVVAKVLETREKLLKPENPLTAQSRSLVAKCCQRQGDPNDALPLLERAAVAFAAAGWAIDATWMLDWQAACYRNLNDDQAAVRCFGKAADRFAELGHDEARAKCLDNLAAVHYANSDFARAEPILRETRDIRRKISGDEHPAYATSLDNLGIVYNAQGKYAEAEPLFRQALGIRQKALGCQHPDYIATAGSLVATLEQLASLHESRDEYVEARTKREEVLAVESKLYSERDWRLINARLALHDSALLPQLEPPERKALKQAIGQLAEVRTRTASGAYGELIAAVESALATMRRIVGDEHHHTGDAWALLGFLREKMSDLAGAEIADCRALEIRSKVLGEEHPLYATSLNNLGAVYFRQGDDARAERFVRKALNIRKETLGEAHPDYATSLESLGAIYYRRGDYLNAEPHCRQAAEITRKLFGDEHPDYESRLSILELVLEELAREQESRDDFAAARAKRAEVLAIKTKLHGENHWQVTDARLALADDELWDALSPADLARLKTASERLKAAEDAASGDALPKRIALACEGRSSRQAILPKKHRLTADAWSILASLHKQQSDFARAEAAASEALSIRELMLGKLHPDYAAALNVLGEIYFSQNKFARARPLFREALEIRRSVLAEQHLDYATSLHNLGAVLAARDYDQHDYDQAEPLLRESLEVRRRILSGRLPNRAAMFKALGGLRQALDTLGGLYWARSEYAKAEPLLRESLEICQNAVGADDAACIEPLDLLARFYVAWGKYALAAPLCRQSLEIRENKIGKQNSDYIVNLNNLASVLHSQGDYAAAVPLLREAVEIAKAVLGREHPEYTAHINNLLVVLGNSANDHESRDEFAAARVRREEIRAITADMYGGGHWRVIEAKLAVADDDVWAALSPTQRARLRELDAPLKAIVEQTSDETLAKRFASVTDAISVRQDALGKKHHKTAHAYFALAQLHKEGLDFAKAEAAAWSAIEIYTATLGKLHPNYAAALRSVGDLYVSQKDFPRAEPFFREALNIRRQTLDENDPQYIANLNDLGFVCQSQRDDANAERLYRRTLELITPRADERPPYMKTLGNLANLYSSRNDRESEEALYKEAIAICSKIVGREHPDYPALQKRLADLYLSRDEYDKAEPLLLQVLEFYKQRAVAIGASSDGSREYYECLTALGNLYYQKRDYPRAEPFVGHSLDMACEIVGERDWDFVTGLNNLALIYDAEGAYTQAEPLFLQALALGREIGGSKNPGYSRLLLNTAKMHLKQGEFGRAELMLSAMVDLCRTLRVSQAHETTLWADSMHLLAHAYWEKGDFARAVLLAREALRMRKELLGSEHPAYADSLNTLAVLSGYLGDYVGAESLFQEALKLENKIDKASFAAIVNNIGLLHIQQGKYDRAEPFCLRALEMAKDIYKARGPRYALPLGNLALLYTYKKEYAEAEKLYRETIAICRQPEGATHPDSARMFNGLAGLYRRQRDFSRAEQVYAEALEFCVANLGKEHPNYAANLRDLALLHCEQGKYGAAHDRGRQAIQIISQARSLAGDVLSERQQLAMLDDCREYLDVYLSAATGSGRPVPETYATVLAWKGTVTSRQRMVRQFRQGATQEVLRLYDELTRASRGLAKLTLDGAGADGAAEWRRRRLTELKAEAESAEQRLAAASSEFRNMQDAARCTADQLCANIPAGATFVDVVEYTHYGPQPAIGQDAMRERRLAAFVLGNDGSVSFCDFGSASDIGRRINLWLGEGATPDDRHEAGEGDVAATAGNELRKILWEPLEPLLAGSRLVLIAPDGALCRLPWAALPGNAKGTYLLEDGYDFVIVPAPQLLPEIVDTKKRPAAEGRLLVLGNVDYGKGEPLHAFLSSPASPLGSSLTEINDVSATYSDLALGAANGSTARICKLRDYLQPGNKRLATKAQFCAEAPSCRYLHLATHGFFMRPDVKSWAQNSRDVRFAFAAGAVQEISGADPELLSGLMLSGANNAPQGDEDDGILTALELAQLDLHEADLAVLSACETGLGEVAGGEGALGLQRALHVAGVRSAITTLWKVNDRVTQQWMSVFYHELWGAGASPLAAMRKAQLATLNNERRNRGWDVHNQNEIPARMPPQFWAAFVLSGDWR